MNSFTALNSLVQSSSVKTTGYSAKIFPSKADKVFLTLSASPALAALTAYLIVAFYYFKEVREVSKACYYLSTYSITKANLFLASTDLLAVKNLVVSYKASSIATLTFSFDSTSLTSLAASTLVTAWSSTLLTQASSSVVRSVNALYISSSLAFSSSLESLSSFTASDNSLISD